MKNEKFISIIFKSNPKESNVTLLVDFLKGLIGNYINPIYKDRVLTVFFDAASNISFSEIIESLNEDFYMTSLLFESGILYNSLNKEEYVSFITENKDKLLGTNKLYINELNLIEKNIYDEIVAKNILKKYY